jgi:hypothetical protein
MITTSLSRIPILRVYGRSRPCRSGLIRHSDFRGASGSAGPTALESGMDSHRQTSGHGAGERLFSRGWLRVVGLFAIGLLLASSSLHGDQPDSTPSASTSLHAGAYLSRQAAEARGRKETYLHVDRGGRYSVTAASPQGTALQIVDRLSGPGPIQGKAGETDGRVDLFLDPGEYKVVTHSDPEGVGKVRLEVRPFNELHSDSAPRLVELRTLASTLMDLQQRSWWIEVRHRRVVAIEAAGRALADLRLFRNGNWMEDAMPVSTRIEPTPGRVLAVRRLVAELSRGLYRLTAFGGPAATWATAAEQFPLHVRFGIPALGAAERQFHTGSPFGIERWRVPRAASYFRLELPDAAPALLRVADYDERNPFTAAGRKQGINKRSAPSVAEIDLPLRRQGFYLVTVEREPGLPYVLQHFQPSSREKLEGEGHYWISTLSGSHEADVVPATAVVTRRFHSSSGESGEEVIATRAVALRTGHGWEARFNLLAPLTLFVQVEEPGRYVIEGEGVRARFRVEPFSVATPTDPVPPPVEPSGQAWDLAAGLYVLTIQPEPRGKGILRLRVFSEELPPGSSSRMASGFAEPRAVFANLLLERGVRYDLHLNQRPGVRTGIVQRSLPISLPPALPLAQCERSTKTLEVLVPERGRLAALADDGRSLPIALDSGGWRDELAVVRGSQQVRIHNPGDALAQYSLVFTPADLLPGAPLPVLSPDLFDAPPRLPLLGQSEPLFFDVRRGEQRSFQLRIVARGMYRLESTGLLETEGRLRTAARVSLAQERANGVGRNFLIQQYLPPGDYQLSVSPVGRTQGHLGVRLTRTELLSGGTLLTGIPARASLQAGAGLLYEIQIDKGERFRLRAMAPGRRLRVRLEDAEGWPVVAPGSAGDLERELEPGRYRLYVLPEPVDTRTLTLLERVRQPRRFSGHGPHRIALEEPVQHVWREPDTGQPRLPDRWQFEVPAPLVAHLELAQELRARVLRTGPGDTQTEVAVVPAEGSWEGPLEPGKHVLEVQGRRINDLLPYEFRIRSRELVTGTQREVKAPVRIPISVGNPGLVSFSSLGDEDVQASLSDERGTVLARNDDRSHDWNFLIQQPLLPGRYELRVEPVERKEASVSVAMRQPRVARTEPVAAPALLRLMLDGAYELPVQISDASPVLVVSARADREIGIAVEQVASGLHAPGPSLPPKVVADARGAPWRILAEAVGRQPSLAALLPATPSAASSTPAMPGAAAPFSLRLRIWPTQVGRSDVRLELDTPTPITVSEQALIGKGIELRGSGADPQWSLSAVSLERPGTFRALAGAPGWSWGALRGKAFVPGERLLSATGTQLWVLAPAGAANHERARAERVRLDPATTPNLLLELPAQAQSTGARAPFPAALVDVAARPGIPLALLVESTLGAPGLTLEGAHAQPFVAHRMGVAERSALALLLDPSDQTSAALWNSQDREEPLKVHLRSYSFVNVRHRSLDWGTHDLTLAPDQGLRCSLPAGPKSLRLSLPGAAAVGLTRDGELERVLWAGATPTRQTLESTADRLWLLPLRTEAGMASVILAPAQTERGVELLRPGRLLRKRFTGSGIHHVSVDRALQAASKELRACARIHPRLRTHLPASGSVAAPPRSARKVPATLPDPGAPAPCRAPAGRPSPGAESFSQALRVRVLGAGAEPMFVGDDGRVSGAEPIVARSGGTLAIRHGPGLLVAWVEAIGEALEAPWSADHTAVQPVRASRETWELSGPSRHFRFDRSSPGWLQLRTGVPVLLRILGSEHTRDGLLDLFPNGAEVRTYLPAGTSMLAVAAADRDLAGSIEIEMGPIPRLEEGLGPSVLLAPGEKRAFGFALERSAHVGVAAHSASDRVNTALLREDGKPLGEGNVQIHELEAGSYVLLLEAPPDGAPVAARPVAVGIDPPPTGPPAEVIEQYLQAAGLVPDRQGPGEAP